MFHAFGTSKGMTAARCHTQIGRQESHSCSCCLDVNHIGPVTQRSYDDFRVIAVAQVLWKGMTAREGMQNQCAVTDAFRGWQFYGITQMFGRINGILHECFLFFLQMYEFIP